MKKLEVIQKDLKYNLNLIKNKINSDKTKIIAIVKANGMGLDLIKYSEFLINNGIEILAVANTFEGINLRQAGIKEKIIMLSEVSSEEELKDLIDNDIILTIGNLEEKKKIEEIANQKEKQVEVHIKIDTGFGRYGFVYTDENTILKASKSTEHVKVVRGLYTFFKSNRFKMDKYSI